MELDWTKFVANIITTSTGKVGPIFEGLRPKKYEIPESISELAKTKEDMLELNFDSLTWEQKRDVIREASAVRGQEFFSDRKIKGLRIVKEYEVKLDRAYILNGVSYGPGKVRLPLFNLFSNKIEFMGPIDMSFFDGVELHVRQPRQAGEVSADAVRLARILGLPSEAQHVHMISALDFEAIKENPKVSIAKLAFLFRDSNLFLEMLDIVETGAQVRKVAADGAVYFDSLTVDRLYGVAKYFELVAAGERPQIKTMYKMGWVGFRGLDFYDGEGLFGLEWRSVSPDAVGSQTYQAILNNAHKIMAGGEFTTPKDVVEGWVKEKAGKRTIPERVQDTWYNQEAEYFKVSANASAQEYAKKHPDFFKSIDTQVTTQGNQIRMLLFDWSKDPLVNSDPVLLKRIEAAQKLIFAKVKPAVFDQYVAGFLYETGLYAKYANVFGIPMKRPTEAKDPFWKKVVAIVK